MSNGKGSNRRPRLVSDRTVTLRWWLTYRAPRVVKIFVWAFGL